MRPHGSFTAVTACEPSWGRPIHTPMSIVEERIDPVALEPIEENMPPARLVLTVESWNEVVRLVEAPPEPTDELRRLFHDER